jgi:hypothetical protein
MSRFAGRLHHVSLLFMKTYLLAGGGSFDGSSYGFRKVETAI